jgi:hypothetical protein
VGTLTGPSGTGSSLATGGSAAGGKTMDRSKVNETGQGLNGQSKAMAHDGGTFSKSQTKCETARASTRARRRCRMYPARSR